MNNAIRKAFGIMPFTVFFLFCFQVAMVFADRGKAESLNAEGYRLYQAGKYGQAFESFRKAVNEDNTYGQAHYNVACTMGVLRKKEGPCGEHEIYKSTIIHHLNQTLKHLPEKRSKMIKDPDLIPVHDTFGWQIILGRSTKSTEDVKKILAEVPWYGPNPGAYGPYAGFDFHNDGTVDYWFLDMEAEPIGRKKQKGTYSVNQNKIKIMIKNSDGKQRSFSGTLSKDGILQFEGENAPHGKFSDDPDECSA